MTRLDERCTFHRGGLWCGEVREDETVHVWPSERMEPGKHVWRHEARDAGQLGEGIVRNRLLRGLQTDEEAAVAEQIADILDPLPQATRTRVIEKLAGAGAA